MNSIGSRYIPNELLFVFWEYHNVSGAWRQQQEFTYLIYNAIILEDGTGHWGILLVIASHFLTRQSGARYPTTVTLWQSLCHRRESNSCRISRVYDEWLNGSWDLLEFGSKEISLKFVSGTNGMQKFGAIKLWLFLERTKFMLVVINYLQLFVNYYSRKSSRIRFHWK